MVSLPSGWRFKWTADGWMNLTAFAIGSKGSWGAAASQAGLHRPCKTWLIFLSGLVIRLNMTQISVITWKSHWRALAVLWHTVKFLWKWCPGAMAPGANMVTAPSQSRNIFVQWYRGSHVVCMACPIGMTANITFSESPFSKDDYFFSKSDNGRHL